MLTLAQLRKIMPSAPSSRLTAVLPVLNKVAQQYEINTERRMAAWLATLAVESGEFRYQQEIASGAAYEGRKDLGNTQKGDGRKFKGHGRIQITGRANHKSYTDYLKKSKHLPFVDFTQDASRLAEEPYATDSAGWFWAKFKNLNAPADRGDFLTTQVKVNGRNRKTGLPNHWNVRNSYFTKALSVLPDDFKLEKTLAAPQAATMAVDTTEVTEATETTTTSTEATEGKAETTEVVQRNEQDVNTSATVPTNQYQNIGLIGVLKKDFAAVGFGNIGFQGLSAYAQQASGLPEWAIGWIRNIAILAAVLGLGWLLFRFGHYLVWKLNESNRETIQATANSDVTKKDVTFT